MPQQTHGIDHRFRSTLQALPQNEEMDMAIARSYLLNDETEGTYHCISRIVRRAFLCGRDASTQRDYEHRKVWINQRLQELAGIFTIDVCGYAVMANHLRVILRNRPDLAKEASDRDIALRWWYLFPWSHL